MNKRIWPAALAAAAFTLVAIAAQAQTPPAAPKAAPKAAPAAPKAAPKGTPAPLPQAPGQQQAQPGADQQTPQLIYSPWTKFCIKGQEANAKQFCFTGKDGRLESGMSVVAAIIIEPEGEPRKLLRVTLPLGMSLPQGTRVIIDTNEAAAKQSPYAFCLQNGCTSDYEATPEVLASLKKGTTLFVQAIQANGVAVTLQLPLGDFAKAYDGPPTDPKVLEEQQKKLQDELQKRANETREKLEKSGQAPKQ